MANCKVTKMTQTAGAKPAAIKAGASVADFVLIDNQNDTCSIFGVDAGGQQVDISSVATLAVTSSDPTIITVTVTGMTFKMVATGKLSVPGTPVNLVATATWTAGGVGPFSFTLPCDVVAGAVTGIVIVPGTPVAN